MIPAIPRNVYDHILYIEMQSFFIITVIVSIIISTTTIIIIIIIIISVVITIIFIIISLTLGYSHAQSVNTQERRSVVNSSSDFNITQQGLVSKVKHGIKNYNSVGYSSLVPGYDSWQEGEAYDQY